MAYHGYIPFIHQVAKLFEEPIILEIGILSGITTISLASRLSKTHEKFLYEGVDILVRRDVVETIGYMGVASDSVLLYEQNSLEFLKNCKNIYDIVLIDGDHNYFTVKGELEHLKKITHQHSLVVVDDYYGKWAEKDDFYSEKKEYSKVNMATKRVASESEGVKPAVDQFLSENPEWSSFSLMTGDAIILMQKDAEWRPRRIDGLQDPSPIAPWDSK